MWDLEIPFEAELFSIPVQQAFQQSPVQEPKLITVIDYDISLGVVMFVDDQGLFSTTSFDRVKALPRVKASPGFTSTKA